MNDREKHCHSEEVYDPESLAIAGLVLGGISAAAGVYHLGKSEYKDWKSRRYNLRSKKAAVLKWEAELFDFRNRLILLQGFLDSVSYHRNKGLLSNPLEPLKRPLYLDKGQLRTYRTLVGKLATQSKKLSDTTCDLLPEIEDEKARRFLKKSIPHAREILQQIKDMKSLGAVLAGGIEFIGKLEKIAQYLLNEVIS